jgi:hypothetical protein
MSKRYVALCAALPVGAYAHGIDERYDLPAPLEYFIAGATAVVAISFAIALVFARAAPAGASAPRRFRIDALPALHVAARTLGLVLLAATIVAGLFGTRDPVMNLAPTLVWIVWWVGLTIVCACVGNVWPAIDPWRTLFDVADRAARSMGRREGLAARCPYPRALAAWPAVAMLIFIGWFEVVYPEGAEPRRIAHAALAWTAITLFGSFALGPQAWRRNADVFSIYFCTLGRFAPLARGADAWTLELRAPGCGLVGEPISLSRVAFVIAMLAIVLFDGLLSGETWYATQARVMREIPQLANPRGAAAGAVSLVVLWMLLFGAYALACTAAAKLAQRGSATATMGRFALTLVPIAVGYAIAHNASHLVGQGQHVVALLSDPLGRQWNLFGTAGFRADTALMGPRSTWYVAVAAIVTGHAIAIWLAHRVALRDSASAHRAALACVPLTLVMLLYTAISLAIIAEPMVRFEPPHR